MTTTDSLYRTAVEERYQVLRAALRIASRRPDWGLRLDQTAAIRQELRALVRVRWFVRRAERARPDPITQAKAFDDASWDRHYHDWQAAGPVS